MDRQSNKITAVYCRLAHYDDDMDRATAWNQMDQLTRYVSEQELATPELFCDWGFSGLNDKRPQYQRMIRAIEAGTVSDLVVQDYSRLGRNTQMCSKFVEIFLPRHGVTFHAVKDSIIYTPQALNELAAQREAIYALFQQMRREMAQQASHSPASTPLP